MDYDDDDNVNVVVKRLQRDIRAGFSVIFFLLVLLVFNTFHILSDNNNNNNTCNECKHGKQTYQVEMQGAVYCVARDRIKW